MAQAAFHLDASLLGIAAVWTVLLVTIASSSALGLANAGMSVAIERDWWVLLVTWLTPG